MPPVYLHHRINCAARCWSQVADNIQQSKLLKTADGASAIYGIWRSQIGLPRDSLTMISVWPDAATASSIAANTHRELPLIKSSTAAIMRPTLRPKSNEPPVKQGNYAFRWFETPRKNFNEFLQLCTEAWPSFESSYESQIIGLWQLEDTDSDMISSLLLTRRPDLSMWERSKIHRTPEEIATREKLTRRYALCENTVVYTTTLLTAHDSIDSVNWS